MFRPLLLSALLSLITIASTAQTNISVTNPLAEQVIAGNYNPSNFPGLNTVSLPDRVICEIQEELSADSMLSYLEDMDTFFTRHTYSDTVSSTTGIGAARRWACAKMQSFSDNGSGRLIPAFLQFDYPNGDCGPGFGWRNVLGVLPGADVNDHNVVIVEAHFDSRCEVRCDTACYAPGMEDNGSGSALVLELARVMSNYVFDHTIIFMLTIGEEEGLYGAEAMAEYCVMNNVPLKGVLNNDIVGGIECGNTSSPPSCPGVGHIDSLQVRIFSSPAQFQRARNFARTVKTYYTEKIVDVVDVPMTVSLIGQEDRTGRGGDHIPFRALGFRAIRFTSANEHGDADMTNPNYVDRQHTSDDILGIDTNGDQVIDEFYVDFNYLRRNAVINGATAALVASGPRVPNFTLFDEPTGLRISIEPDPDFAEYRIGVRTDPASLDFDEFYRITDTSFVIPNQTTGTARRVSVAAIDSKGVMSPFGDERSAFSDVNTPPGVLDNLPYGIDCTTVGINDPLVPGTSGITMSATPNPWSKSTELRIVLTDRTLYGNSAVLLIQDALGRDEIRRTLTLTGGTTVVPISTLSRSGIYHYSLLINGQLVASEKMIYTRN